ncbi:AMP-binding protein (plasmid) [Streptomyces viridifaciens]|nr:AMP-binding protein [Streptomyces viridifaciens]
MNTFDQQSLCDVVQERAERDPHGLALVELRDEHDLCLSWGQLAEQADRAATTLLDLGVRPGESVMVQLPNSIDFVVMSLATLRIGAVCCPVLPILGQRELVYVLERSRARVLVTPADFRGRQHAREALELAAAGRTAHLRHLLVTGGTASLTDERCGIRQVPRLGVHDLAARIAATPAGPLTGVGERSLHDVAHLLFTSGTTGEPKGVPHRMRTLNQAVSLMSRRVGLTADDRVHIASPMAHHSGFLYGMWLSLLLGCVQVIQPVWNAPLALRAFAQWRGTFMQGAAPFLLDMVTAVHNAQPAPHSLRTFVVTGAAVPRRLAAEARDVLGARICAAWGSTETCMATLSAPQDDLGTVADGRPLDGVRVRAVDEGGIDVGTGREGLLEVTGPFVFDGYLDRDDLTAEAFTADGWYRSGDLAVIEPSGCVRITGRVKDVVNRGGEKIPVGEIEQILLAHPAIRDAAIVAMPDLRLGERACLFAVTHPGRVIKLEDVQSHLATHMVTKSFWPEHIEFIDELPRNPAGKIQKYLLREIARGVAASA